MAITLDILKTIEQIRTFLKEESDTAFSLIFFLLAELFLAGIAVVQYFPDHVNTLPYIIVVLYVFTVFFWMLHRHISVPRHSFSIAIANLKIISLNLKEEMIGEKKHELEEEILEYIEDSLHAHKNRLEFDRYINVIRLSPRFQMNESNARKITRKIKANVLISGVVKYQSPTEIYVEPHFNFFVEPQESFYQAFRKRISDVGSFKIDPTKELSNQLNNSFSSLIHYLIYIALLFEGIRFMNTREFERSHKIFSVGKSSIMSITNPNRTLLDIHLAMQFYEGKNLHAWGKWLERHHDPSAIDKYDEATRIFFQQPKHLPKKEKELFLEHSYLYAVHLLIKEGKIAEAKKKLDAIKRKLKENPELVKEEFEILNRENKKRAEKFSKKIKTGKKENARVYEQIGSFFYTQGRFDDARAYYQQRVKANPKQIYEPALFDVDDHLKLMDIHLKNLELIQAQKEGLEVFINRLRNKTIKKI